MIVGDLKDPEYLRRRPIYDEAVTAGTEGLEVPQPPRLSPKEATAVANCVRTWLECRNDELEARIHVVAETNEMVLKLLADRAIDVIGGGLLNN
jgi:hypothetical protein